MGNHTSEAEYKNFNRFPSVKRKFVYSVVLLICSFFALLFIFIVELSEMRNYINRLATLFHLKMAKPEHDHFPQLIYKS